MSKIKEFTKGKGVDLKDTKKEKPTKAFQTMSANEKWAIVEKMAKDLGYIDK